MKLKSTLYLLLLLPTIIFAQHTIKVTFSPAKDFTWAILYKNTSANNKYIAQGKIEDGNLVFNLDESADAGIYKLVYAVPQNEYNFDIIYNATEDIEITFNLKDGPVFKKSSENKLLNDYLNDFTTLGKELETLYTQSSIDKEALENLYKKQIATQKNYEKKSGGKLVNHFIKGNKPYIPKQYEAPEVYVENLTKNYFTNIDFNDEVLQSSNFLVEKSLAYITGVILDKASKKPSYNANIDEVILKINNTEANFKKVFLVTIYQKLIANKLVDPANYLAEKHLISLANKQNDKALALKLIQFKNLSIGNVAPDFTWETTENKTVKTNKLSELAVAENYILVFWGSTCSHCLKEIPKLNQSVQSLDSFKYKVVAIGLENEPVNWQTEIKKYPDFIHVIKLKKWDNKIVQEYGLTGTPTYFVLDKDKKFIAKPENLEELQKFINDSN